MLDVEVFGSELLAEQLSPARVRRLCALAVAHAGIEDGHLAIEFVDPTRIAELNERHLGKAGPTDVLSFPIDGVDASGVDGVGGASVTDGVGGARVADGVGGQGVADGVGGAGVADGVGGQVRETHTGAPRELGDIVICPEHTADLREAIVHGALHLIGMDHETDDGQMLAVQAEILRRA